MMSDADSLFEALLLGLVIFAAIAAVGTTVAAVGCWCAYRAGRGSTAALVAWILLASVEVVVQVLAVPVMFNGTFSVFLLFPGAALVVQAVLYLVTRSRPSSSPPGTEPGPPPPAW